MTPIDEITDQVRCDFINYEQRRCVRLKHGDEIRHKYQGNQATAGAQFAATYRVVQGRKAHLRVAKIGRYAVGLGEAVGLDSNGTIPNEGRGWLGVLKEVYEQDGTVYAVIVGAKTGKAVRERIVPMDRLEYIRPGTEKARKAKIRVGRAV